MMNAELQDFLSRLDNDAAAFYLDTHDLLTACYGLTPAIRETKQGMVCAYNHKKTFRTPVKYTATGGGLRMQIRAAHLADYTDFLNTLPPDMRTAMVKGINCSHTAERGGCGPWGGSKCNGGFAFSFGEEAYRKCRYNNFNFTFTPDTAPYLRAMMEQECAVSFDTTRSPSSHG